MSPATVGMMRTVTAAGRATRRHDLDWLRSVAVLLLIPFHAARIFVRWSLGAAMKWAVISVVGGAATLALYEVLVRRSRIMRFLFGMKPAARA